MAVRYKGGRECGSGVRTRNVALGLGEQKEDMRGQGSGCLSQSGSCDRNTVDGAAHTDIHLTALGAASPTSNLRQVWCLVRPVSWCMDDSFLAVSPHGGRGQGTLIPS